MGTIKFVIKCGKFAVLVDLHILPLGDQQDCSWFSTSYIKEVTGLVRDPVDQRVKQYSELLHNRRQMKQKKELAPAPAFMAKGENFSLVANFLKRHCNLRCVVKQDLRLFPERYIVCVSCPEDASAHRRNPSPAAAELSQQSKSEYFLSARETQELLNSLTKKKSVLQKLAKQARVQREVFDSTTERDKACAKKQRCKLKFGESPEEADRKETRNVSSVVSQTQTSDAPKQKQVAGAETSVKRDAGEDPKAPQAKRACLDGSASVVHSSTGFPLQTSERDLRAPFPRPPVEAGVESKAFHVSESQKTTVEVEPLTPGKRAQGLPLTSNNTAQTNQNRLATSLRGLSVKPASSGSSIGSRSTLEEEGE